MYDEIGDVKAQLAWGKDFAFDFAFPFISGFDFGVAFALSTKARFQSLGGNGPTSHVFDPLTAGP